MKFWPLRNEAEFLNDGFSSEKIFGRCCKGAYTGLPLKSLYLLLS